MTDEEYLEGRGFVLEDDIWKGSPGNFCWKTPEGWYAHIWVANEGTRLTCEGAATAELALRSVTPQPLRPCAQCGEAEHGEAGPHHCRTCGAPRIREMSEGPSCLAP